jgi:hypothetical protein
MGSKYRHPGLGSDTTWNLMWKMTNIFKSSMKTFQFVVHFIHEFNWTWHVLLVSEFDMLNDVSISNTSQPSRQRVKPAPRRWRRKYFHFSFHLMSLRMSTGTAKVTSINF